VSVKADKGLQYEVVKDLVVALEVRRARVGRVHAGVSERENP
jgi:hypothetical protein